ncbi:MAG: hypothetical protein LBV51_05125 [Acholeplasmatales bacterium]|jgi:hypothetical protein|nr:hypothetical protein [Acholeplasmatales bacterium]
MNEQKKEFKGSKKIALLLLLLLLLVGGAVGAAYSFFTDAYTGNSIAVTAGTLNISGTETMKQNGVVKSSLDNINPGDAIVVTAAITNNGSKSAWLKAELDFGTIPANLLAGLTFWEGEYTSAEIAQFISSADNSKKLTLDSGKISSGAVIIDGTGTAAETESDSAESFDDNYVFAGSNVYSIQFTIYLSPTAGNECQGLTFNVTAAAYAIQYRNNDQSIPTF